MTLPKLLFVLAQKGIVLSEGAKERIRFNPRQGVTGGLRQAIHDHKPALLELLRGGDLDGWRHVRLKPPRTDEYREVAMDVPPVYPDDDMMVDESVIEQMRQLEEAYYDEEAALDDEVVFHPDDEEVWV